MSDASFAREEGSMGERPAAPSRVGRAVLAGAVLLLGGLVLGAVGVAGYRGWRSDRADAVDVLRPAPDATDPDATGPEDTGALDAGAAADALRVLDDDGALTAAAIEFALGALAAGAGAGLLIARTRRRRQRLALHPSLVAAADRKLEKVLAENAQDLVTMLDQHGRFTYVSPSVSAILGRDPAGMIGLRFGDVLEAVEDESRRSDRDAASTGTASAVDADLDAERRAGEPQRHRARHADGSVRWLETLSHQVDDDRAIGAVTLYSSRDITERVRLEQTLVAERRMLGDTLANIHAGILSVDLHGVVIDANTEFCAMVGFQPVAGDRVDAIEQRYAVLDGEGEDLGAQRPILRALQGDTMKQVAATLVGEDGGRHDVIANAGPLVGSDGQRTGAVLTLHDVSELRAAEAELRSLATVDSLTGLPNRRAFVSALSDALRRNTDTPERLALLFLDLDGFKAVNDTWGHDVGDQVLMLAGGRLAGCLRGGDLVARLGGDEFVVVVEHLNDASDLLPLVHRIERAMSTPFELATATVTIGASIGVASGLEASGAAELLGLADRAMYARKRERSGRSTVSAAI